MRICGSLLDKETEFPGLHRQLQMRVEGKDQPVTLPNSRQVSARLLRRHGEVPLAAPHVRHFRGQLAVVGVEGKCFFIGVCCFERTVERQE